MQKRNKIWLVLGAAVVGILTLACSCNAISALVATPTPLPTATPIPTPTPIPEPMPGLEGVWRDNLEGTVHTIAWDGESYHVVSSINDERGVYDITDEYWDGDTFTWTYYVSATDVAVTIQATSISGNIMYLNWWSTNGNSGTDTFTRE